MNSDEDKNTTGGDDSGHDGSLVKKEDFSEQPDFCSFCENDPCIIKEIGEMLNAILLTNHDSKGNKQICFCM